MSDTAEPVSGLNTTGPGGPVSASAGIATPNAGTVPTVTHNGTVTVVVTNPHGQVISYTTKPRPHNTNSVTTADGALTLVVSDGAGHVIQTTTIEAAVAHAALNHAGPFLNIAV